MKHVPSVLSPVEGFSSKTAYFSAGLNKSDFLLDYYHRESQKRAARDEESLVFNTPSGCSTYSSMTSSQIQLSCSQQLQTIDDLKATITSGVRRKRQLIFSQAFRMADYPHDSAAERRSDSNCKSIQSFDQISKTTSLMRTSQLILKRKDSIDKSFEPKKSSLHEPSYNQKIEASNSNNKLNSLSQQTLNYNQIEYLNPFEALLSKQDIIKRDVNSIQRLGLIMAKRQLGKSPSLISIGPTSNGVISIIGGCSSRSSSDFSTSPEENRSGNDQIFGDGSSKYEKRYTIKQEKKSNLINENKILAMKSILGENSWVDTRPQRGKFFGDIRVKRQISQQKRNQRQHQLIQSLQVIPTTPEIIHQIKNQSDAKNIEIGEEKIIVEKRFKEVYSLSEQAISKINFRTPLIPQASLITALSDQKVSQMTQSRQIYRSPTRIQIKLPQIEELIQSPSSFINQRQTQKYFLEAKKSVPSLNQTVCERTSCFPKKARNSKSNSVVSQISDEKPSETIPQSKFTKMNSNPYLIIPSLTNISKLQL